MRCHKYKGAIIPGCMGVAAAFGCGKSDSEIMSFCTCKSEASTHNREVNRDLRLERLERRLAKLEKQLNQLRAADADK